MAQPAQTTSVTVTRQYVLFAAGDSVKNLDAWIQYAKNGGTGATPSTNGIYQSAADPNKLYPASPWNGTGGEFIDFSTSENCFTELAHGGMHSDCLEYLSDFQDTYHPLPKHFGGTSLPNTANYSVVDVGKAIVIDGLQQAENSPVYAQALSFGLTNPFAVRALPLGGNGANGYRSLRNLDSTSRPAQTGGSKTDNSTIDAGYVVDGGHASLDGTKLPRTGMGWLSAGYKGHYAVPSEYSMPIEQTGTVWQLLDQIRSFSRTSQGSTNVSNVINEIHQRCMEIRPDPSTPAMVDALLQSTPLPIGDGKPTKLYLYAVGNNLVCNSSLPPYYSGTTPDGKGANGSYRCYVNYDVNGTLVNTRGNGHSTFGDGNLKYSPYVNYDAEFSTLDEALWTNSSGYGNLLGQLEFSTKFSGGAFFTLPN